MLLRSLLEDAGKTSQRDCMVATCSAESALPSVWSQPTPDELGHITVSYRGEAVLVKVISEATESQSQRSVSHRVDGQAIGLGGTAGEASELGPGLLLFVVLFLLCFGSMVFALEHRYSSETAVTRFQEFRPLCVFSLPWGIPITRIHAAFLSAWSHTCVTDFMILYWEGWTNWCTEILISQHHSSSCIQVRVAEELGKKYVNAEILKWQLKSL